MDEQTPAEGQAEEGEDTAGSLRCTVPFLPEPAPARQAHENLTELGCPQRIVRGGFDLGVGVIIERHAQL